MKFKSHLAKKLFDYSLGNLCNQICNVILLQFQTLRLNISDNFDINFSCLPLHSRLTADACHFSRVTKLFPVRYIRDSFQQQNLFESATLDVL